MISLVHAEALREFSRSVVYQARSIMAPPPDLSFAAWSEKERVLTVESGSAEPGPYRLSRTPYLRGIMDAIYDPFTRIIVIKKASRLGVTEGIINNYIGYRIDLDPGPILVVWPTRDDAMEWSKETLPKLFETTPTLRGKIAPSRERDSNNTILHKRFPGGWLTMVGANSPRTLRRRNARVVLIDEYDACSQSSSPREGDVGQRAIRRADTFADAKIIITGSPELKGGPIDRDYNHSDRRRYYIPCFKCGERFVPTWPAVRWDKTLERAGKVVRWSAMNYSTTIGDAWVTREHHPDTAHLVCMHCNAIVNEVARRHAVPKGEWQAENPGHAVTGFWLNTLVSLFPQAALPNFAEEFLKAQRDKTLLQVFTNTVLGEGWEDREGAANVARLHSRRERYNAEVPLGVGMLMALVDVQATRLELLIKGYGIGEESWNILHTRIEGSPEDPGVWDELDKLWQRPFKHEGGGDIRVRMLLIDAAYLPDEVAKYVKPRRNLNVRAIRSVTQKPGDPLVARGVSKKSGMKLFLPQHEPFADRVVGRLAIREPGPGYIHFPTEDLLDSDYIDQLGNEVPIVVSGKRKFVKKGPNEAFDLEKYAIAGLYILGAAVRYSLPKLVQKRQPQEPGAKQITADVVHPASVARPKKLRRRGRQRFAGYE
jgi:phage terminase large subunit GpA-like protein